jgi:SAM-dependent methyltransferase
MNTDIEETRAMWDRVADDWLLQVGDDGDSNRRLNSDPILWALLGDVNGMAVLDAGCGTGYLSKKLHERGAKVTGIDFSDRMIAIARGRYPEIDFRVDSCSELATAADKQFDLLVSNYVLMDTPDLYGAMAAFYRVLRPGGVAVLIFSHPCFPQDWAIVSPDGEVRYRWPINYFEGSRCVGPPWAHFKSDFIWFQRPLSDYWKSFTAAGFAVEDLEEPRITEDRYHLETSEACLRNAKTRPYSIAFKLRKKTFLHTT